MTIASEAFQAEVSSSPDYQQTVLEECQVGPEATAPHKVRHAGGGKAYIQTIWYHYDKSMIVSNYEIEEI